MQYGLGRGVLGPRRSHRIALILVASMFLPRFIERLTPNIDEDKEIARGNVAVANYFGRVVGASIIGISPRRRRSRPGRNHRRLALTAWAREAW